ncbi:MAG: hypothetical protein Q7U74_16330 [Saprospiraceae bacterium]|nr:hypothetical protein [Saprospiraceae bacterium]
MSEIASFKNNTVVTETHTSWNTIYITKEGYVSLLTLQGGNGL